MRDFSISMIFYSIQNLHLTKTDSLTSDFDYKVSAEQLSLRVVRFMVRDGTSNRTHCSVFALCAILGSS